MYQVSGTDAAGVFYSYVIDVAVNECTCTGVSKLLQVYAGNYRVVPVSISRYVPGNAQNLENSVVSGISGMVWLMIVEKGQVLFSYVISQYEGFGSMDDWSNSFDERTVEICLFRDFI